MGRLAVAACAVLVFAARGALAQSDTFVPLHEEARDDLAIGDRALQRARGSQSTRDWNETFDAWQSALERTTVGDRVPLAVQQESDEVWLDTEGNFARRSEGVAVAVLSRLTRLTQEERRGWRERFGELASNRLLEAPYAAGPLANLERNLPATRAAAIACLRLADLALEGARPESAKTWLERARQHTALAALDAPFAEAFAQRDEFVATLAPERVVEPWERASKLEEIREVDLRARTIGTPPKGSGFDRGLISGGVFLDDGRFVVHHPLAVFVVEESGITGPIFEPRKLLEAFPRQSGATFAPSGQAWPLDPTTDGHDLYFVLGRAIVAGNTSAVCRLTPPPAVGEAASLAWVLSTHGHADADQKITRLSTLLEPGTWEFQPGPKIFESLLIVQARQWLPVGEGAATSVDTSRPRCWVLALDIETGFPVWTRFLGKGSDVQQDFGTRFGGARPAAPAQPVALQGNRAFCATGVGLGVCLTLPDGRIEWSFSPKRRDSEQHGWVRAHRPGFVRGEAGTSILWGPPDSDELYWLRASADLGGDGLETFLPAPIRNARAVVPGGTESAVLLGFSGAKRSLSSLDPNTGEVARALDLRRTEEFRGPSLATPWRVLLCTDRSLYLFDRTRDLLLMESHGLRGGDSLGGGTLVAKGNRIAVLGENRVYLFEAGE